MTWPYLDLTRMTSGAASAISTLLVVVFFAYLVEVTPTARAIYQSGAPRSKRALAGVVVGVAGVTAGFVWGQLPLLAVLNDATPPAGGAESLWIASGVSFGVTVAGTVAAAIQRPAD